ncbi:MAG TPA: fructosamine kinase family protein [Gallionellaceae bacterium]
MKMPVSSDILSSICEATQTRFTLAHAASLAGGCANQAWHIEGTDGRHYLVKLNTADRTNMFDAECNGLAALAATHTVRVPSVIAHGASGAHAFLVLEYLDLHNHGDARLLGTQLAALHRHHGTQYGWERDNTLGLTPQRNSWCDDWLTFWREHRLGFQLELAAHNGFRGRLHTLGQQLMERLPELLADHRPAPSLLHGDLWGGNHAYLADGCPVIFDPATYYGDREADLAMTELFGGFAPAFHAAYHAAYPLDAGYARRKTLYNLYHVLNHCNMIGSGYAGQAEGMMQRLLDGLRG